MYKILFVCTGNICRSPTAEGVFRHLVAEADLADNILVDSSGVHGYHIGESPDPRSINVAKQNGVAMDGLVARKVHANDFMEFDLILAMDGGHKQQLLNLAPENAKSEIDLFLTYAGIEHINEVPDPYYEEEEAFNYVFDLIYSGASKLLAKVTTAHFNG